MLIADHLRKRGHEAVVPSQRYLQVWWGKLNRAFFKGALRPCEITYGPNPEHDAYGLCWGLADGDVAIHLNDRLLDRLSVLSILAHEMVHQWQHQNGKRMTHGTGFKRWVTRLARHGLNL